MTLSLIACIATWIAIVLMWLVGLIIFLHWYVLHTDSFDDPAHLLDLPPSLQRKEPRK